MTQLLKSKENSKLKVLPYQIAKSTPQPHDTIVKHSVVYNLRKYTELFLSNKVATKRKKKVMFMFYFFIKSLPSSNFVYYLVSACNKGEHLLLLVAIMSPLVSYNLIKFA